MADQEEKKVEAVVAAPKRKRLTAEERLLKLQANIDLAAAKAVKRARNTQARRDEKAKQKKAERSTNRSRVTDTLRNQIRRMAENAHLSLSANDIKLPAKIIKADQAKKYFNAAKARYYKRTKKASSFERSVLDAAHTRGINAKYVKVGRSKNINDILKKAEGRKNKNTAKASRGDKRVAILAMAQQQLGLNEKEAMSIICVRKKVEKK